MNAGDAGDAYLVHFKDGAHDGGEIRIDTDGGDVGQVADSDSVACLWIPFL